MIESAKKVFFVSLIRLVAPGEMLQVFVAILVALCALVYQLAASPFKRATDNFLALLGGMAYALLLLGALSLRLASISNELGNQLSLQIRQAFSVPGMPVTVMLLVGTLTSIVFATGVLLHEVVRDWRQPKLRYKDSGVHSTSARGEDPPPLHQPHLDHGAGPGPRAAEQAAGHSTGAADLA